MLEKLKVLQEKLDLDKQIKRTEKKRKKYDPLKDMVKKMEAGEKSLEDLKELVKELNDKDE